MESKKELEQKYRNSKRESIAVDKIGESGQGWYCCECKRRTNGAQDCWNCHHLKGRWQDDSHHCIDALVEAIASAKLVIA